MPVLSEFTMDDVPIDEALRQALPLLEGYGDAMVAYALIRTGLANALAAGEKSECDLITEFAAAYPPAVLKGLIRHALGAGLATKRASQITGTERLRAVVASAGWFRLLIGGYGPTLLAMAEPERDPAPNQVTCNGNDMDLPRNLQEVKVGSCMMSSYGAFPAVCDMLDTFACSTPPIVLDVGCGDGSLGPFLKRRGSQLRYVGIEDPRVTRSEPLRASSGPGSTGEESGIARVSLKDYVAGLAQDERCVIVLSFVLHEILGQHGEGPLRELLSGFAQDPRVVGLVIVEVDAAPTNARLQDSASGRGYYNLYYLIHDITKQRLMPRAFWERLFADCGFNLLAVEHISEKADPLRLEIVFLLERG
jgi:2-ketoarginine methyltransferase